MHPPSGPPYRAASARKKKRHPGEAPGVEVWCFSLVKERPSQGRNLHTLGIDIFAEELICPSPARDGW